FLMTYGWAILVVLIVIGALAYFGVLNPQQFLPQKCQFSQGLVCQDHKIDGGDGVMYIRVNNGLGNDIIIWGLNFTSDNNLVLCGNSTFAPFTLNAGKENTMSVYCGIGVSNGSRVKGDLRLEYQDLQTNFNHTIMGTLLSDVEQ
ncbi:MAG: hypothetical protein ABIC95_05315, partial [archaeon]